MGDPKLASLMCPSCGANLPEVSPDTTSLACPSCQNVVAFEVRRPGGATKPIGTGRKVAAVLVPLFLVTGLTWGGDLYRRAHLRPRSCSDNETLSISTDWQGTTPILESVGVKCKVHITKSKLKGSALLPAKPTNLELWIEDSTIETTDTMMPAGTNPKIHIRNSTLTSAKSVIVAGSNLVLDLAGSTIESTGGTAINASANAKPTLDNSHIRAAQLALTAGVNMELVLKTGSEITSTAGIAVKGTENLHINSEGGKIDGATGAIVSTYNLQIRGKKLALRSEGKTISTGANLVLYLDDSAVTSTGDIAITAEGNSDIELVNTMISGASAFKLTSNAMISTTQKTHIVGTTYDAIIVDSGRITLSDTEVDGAAHGIVAGDDSTVTFMSGGSIVGKHGGVFAASRFAIGGDGAIDGGDGPGVTTKPDAVRIDVNAKGNPPIATH